MTTTLGLIDPTTQVGPYTEISTLAARIAAKTDPSVDIRAFLPAVYETGTYATPELEGALLATRMRLEKGAEVSHFQEGSKHVDELTEADLVALATPGASRQDLTIDGRAIVSYRVPVLVHDEEADRLVQALNDLVSFLRQGQEQGALLRNSDYQVPTEVIAEEPTPESPLVEERVPEEALVTGTAEAV